MVQRRGYSEWVKIVEEFEKSASSLEDFSAKLGGKPSTLQFWFYKLRKQASRASRLLPVNVVALAAPKARQGATETVELALATGALLRFSVGTDVRYVAQIIAALGRPRGRGPPKSVGIYLAATPVDMRNSIDGLAALVRNEWKEDVYCGHLFAFVSKRGDRVKILVWERG